MTRRRIIRPVDSANTLQHDCPNYGTVMQQNSIPCTGGVGLMTSRQPHTKHVTSSPMCQDTSWHVHADFVTTRNTSCHYHHHHPHYRHRPHHYDHHHHHPVSAQGTNSTRPHHLILPALDRLAIALQPVKAQSCPLCGSPRLPQHRRDTRLRSRSTDK